jgi:uncharacterized protein (DUF2236 family)
MNVVVEKLGDYLGTMMQAPPELAFDYAMPAGEEALVAADSVSWRLFKNPVSLFIGGVAAVILELAEPSVRAGVWGHSSFRHDPVRRLQRTGAAAMMTVYGPRSASEKMIAGVVRRHDRVEGVTAGGIRYHANDPNLLDWVQATASFGFIDAYSRFVSTLTPQEMSRVFAEGAGAATLYGARGAPGSLDAWQAMFTRMEPTLEPSDIMEEFLALMERAPLAPAPLRPLQRLMIRAAFDVVPPTLRRKLGLEPRRLNPVQRRAVRMAGRIADRIPVRSAPPVQASVRLGREPFFLYR